MARIPCAVPASGVMSCGIKSECGELFVEILPGSIGNFFLAAPHSLVTHHTCFTMSKKSAFDLSKCARPNILKLQPYRCARE
jgi:hypothetical protein